MPVGSDQSKTRDIEESEPERRVKSRRLPAALQVSDAKIRPYRKESHQEGTMWESDSIAHLDASLGRSGAVVLITLIVLTLLPAAASGQAAAAHDGFDMTDLQHATRVARVWPIFGRVTTLGGEAVLGARVKVDVTGGMPQILETNVKGEFRTEYTLVVDQFSSVHVRVVASKDGYAVAHETADFAGKDGVTREIVVALREESENSDLLSPSALVSSLEKRFRSPDTLASVPESARKNFEKGVAELFGEGSPQEAISSLRKSVNRAPDCVNCRLLLCLADLAADNIVSGDLEEIEIDRLTHSANMPREKVTLQYIAGVVETWRHENANAVGFFQKALEIMPSDSIVLQELGRTLLLQNNWEAADLYLEKAITSGASSEAHLLRARALSEEGDTDTADAEMRAYLGKKPVRELPLAARLAYLDLQRRLELTSQGKVKSVVDESLPELTRAMVELKGIEVAQNQDELPLMLQKIGANVEAFFQNFSNTISQEKTLMENLGQNGKVKASATEKANYLLLARSENWGLGLTEYRANREKNGQNTDPQIGSLRSSGFASASVVFHPSCQNETSFRYLGRQRIGEREVLVIAFAQQPGKAKRIGEFVANGVSEPALVQGIAWVDAQDYHIVRMRTDLLRPLAKVRLVRQTTEIRYGEVHFKDVSAGVWLPQDVIVTVQWRGRTFRNSHHYSDFKLFNVGAEEKRKQG